MTVTPKFLAAAVPEAALKKPEGSVMHDIYYLIAALKPRRCERSLTRIPP